MKPFNLEAALSGVPVVNRAGHKVERLEYFPEAEATTWKVAYVVNGHLSVVMKDGVYNRNCESRQDLFMASKKVTKWVVLFTYNNSYGIDCQSAIVFDTESSANEWSSKNVHRVLGTPVKYEYEE